MGGEDRRMKGQALGLLFNVVGFTAVAPFDAEEEDELRFGAWQLWIRRLVEPFRHMLLAMFSHKTRISHIY